MQRAVLDKIDIATRVVSVPCFELFEAQDDDYKSATLGKEKARVAVEAAVRMGWDRFIGPDGGFVGMNSFGASAPYQDLYNHFRITVDAIVEAVKERVIPINQED